MKRKTNIRNSHIDPRLYEVFLRLKDKVGAQIVHRRRRRSNTCIEIIFNTTLFYSYVGRMNSLKEAEKCGFWIICRAQTKRGHTTWHNHQVFQLFLSPVHPKKSRELKLAAQVIARTLLQSVPQHPVPRKIFQNICICRKKAVPLQSQKNNEERYHEKDISIHRTMPVVRSQCNHRVHPY